jgi:hypothetical protein
MAANMADREREGPHGHGPMTGEVRVLSGM